MPPIVKQRGATLLLVVGIIMIVIGVFSAAGGAMTSGSGSLYSSMYGLDAAAVQFFQIQGIISLVEGLVLLVFGIMGIRFRNRTDKAALLIILGIIQIVVQIFSILYNNAMASMSQYATEQLLAATEAMTGISVSGIDIEFGAGGLLGIVLYVIGFVLPVLFIVGALLNKFLAPKVLQGAPYTQPGAPGASAGAYEQRPGSGAQYAQPGSQAQNDSPYQQGYKPPEEK